MPNTANGVPYVSNAQPLALWATVMGQLAQWIDDARNTRCKIYQTVLQTLVNGATTAVTMIGEEVDPKGLHSAVANTNRVTVLAAGRYEVKCQVAFVANAAGYRQVGIYKNGALVAFQRVLSAGAASATVVQAACSLVCAVNDYIDVQVVQTSGGNLDTVVGAANTFLDVTLGGNV